VILTVPPEAFETLTVEGFRRVRAALLEAIAAVVRARADDPVVRVAPDIEWDVRFGLSFVLWFVAPAVAACPGDAWVPPGLSPGVADLERLLAGLGDLVEEVEIQVVPASAAEHDVVAGGRVDGMTGAMPRWLAGPTGPAFCPVWRVMPEEWEPAALVEAVRALAALPEVAAVRVVPGEPKGLGEAWPQADPTWHVARGRCFLRIRDGLTDRDRLPLTRSRASEPLDGMVEIALAASLMTVPEAREALMPEVSAEGRPRLLRPIEDTAERRGVELRLDPSAICRERVLRAVLDGIGGLDPRAACTLSTWGYRNDSAVVQLWYPAVGPLEPEREWC
jgi:hypothetical protein